MTPVHYVIIGVIVLAIFMSRGFVQQRLFAGKPLAMQGRWEWLGRFMSVLWAISLITVGNVLRAGGFTDQIELALSIAVETLLGLATIWVFYRWLQKADELVRKIETEALALGFGLSAVGIIAAVQLGSAGVHLFADTSVDPAGGLLLVMFLGMAIARVTVYKRYR